MPTRLLFLLLAACAASSLTAAQSTKDPVTDLVARTGELAVQSVGPYVERGTYQVQVHAKLGRPTAILPDGRWLYGTYRADGSSAAGCLVLRFENGRVKDLHLIAPALAAALRRGTPAGAHYASGGRR